MKASFFIFFLFGNVLLFAQTERKYEITDSVLILGEKQDVKNLVYRNITIADLSSAGYMNYDMFSYLKILGIRSSNDYSSIPYTEGADINEQLFYINSIPVPFQSRLLGLQSGLNSLMFSRISVSGLKTLDSFDKPTQFSVHTSEIDTSGIFLKSNLSFLHTEELLSVPLSNGSGGILFGYNRSLLETIQPFLSNYSTTDRSGYHSFPFFQAAQVYAEFGDEDLSIHPLLLFSEDDGFVEISSTKFSFASHQLTAGVEVYSKLGAISNFDVLYFSSGGNSVDYNFLETRSEFVDGKALFSFKDAGLHHTSEFLLSPNNFIGFSFDYRYSSASSENETLYLNITNKKSASFASAYFSSSLFCRSILTNELLLTLSAGLNSVIPPHLLPTLGIHLVYAADASFDAELLVTYKETQEPSNPIFFTFQNAVWDPSATSSLYFVDDTNLSIKSLRVFNTSLRFRKFMSTRHLEAEGGVTVFFRSMQNLMYANNYPNDVTVYNTDFGFNQNFEAIRYGISFVLNTCARSIGLRLINTLSLCSSAARGKGTEYWFNSLNYSPLSFSSLALLDYDPLYFSVLFLYGSGRFNFEKELVKYISTVDSSVTYAMSTDYRNQFQLLPYKRLDASVMYKILEGNFSLNCGVSVLNILDTQNESKRDFTLNVKKKSIFSKSEYYNVPRIFIIEFSMIYAL